MRRLSNNTLILLANNLFTAGLAFILNIIIARGMGDAALGRYTAVMTWILPLTLFVEFGVATLITRDVAQNYGLARPYLQRTYLFRWGLGLAVVVMVWLLAPLLSNDERIVMGLRVGVWLVLIDALFASYTGVFRAWEIMWPILGLNVGLLTLQVGGALWVIWQQASIVMLFGVIVLADGVQLIATWLVWRWLARRKTAAPLTISTRQLVKGAFPFMVAGVLAILQARVMILVLEQSRGPSEVGQFAVAMRFIEAGRLVPNALFVALLPNLAALVTVPAQFRRTFQRAGGLVALYSIVFGLLALLLARPLIQLVFGDGFGEGAAVFTLLAWLLLPSVLRMLFTLWHYAYHREGFVNVGLLMALILQVVLGVILIEQWGIYGAAWGMIGAEVFLALLLGATALRMGGK
jgi:O-antigen/teichoic acid export membrane protein